MRAPASAERLLRTLVIGPTTAAVLRQTWRTLPRSCERGPVSPRQPHDRCRQIPCLRPKSARGSSATSNVASGGAKSTTSPTWHPVRSTPSIRSACLRVKRTFIPSSCESNLRSETEGGELCDFSKRGAQPLVGEDDEGSLCSAAPDRHRPICGPDIERARWPASCRSSSEGRRSDRDCVSPREAVSPPRTGSARRHPRYLKPRSMTSLRDRLLAIRSRAELRPNRTNPRSFWGG